MKLFNAFVVGAIFAAALMLGGAQEANAQETMMKQAANKVVRGSKKTYRTSRRVGTTIGNRTWTGTKWVASSSWQGGKWVAVKTANGTKWVYRKGKRSVRGTKRRVL